MRPLALILLLQICIGLEVPAIPQEQLIIAGRTTALQGTIKPTFAEPIQYKNITPLLIDEYVENSKNEGVEPSEIFFEHCNFDPGSISRLLEAYPKLESLQLLFCEINGGDFSEFAAGTYLRSLALTKSFATDFNLQVLSNCPRLERLNLERTLVTGAFLHKLPAPKLLTELNLHGTLLNNRTILALKRFENLKRLDIDSTRCDADGFRQLGILPSLSEIDFPIKFSPSKWFAAVIQQPNLEVICGSKMTQLDFTGWKLEDEGFLSINHDLPTVRLNISRNLISDRALPAFKFLPDLKELRANQCLFTGDDFGAAPTFKKLKLLSLDYNRLSSSGLKQIGKLESLQSLSLQQSLPKLEKDRLAGIAELKLQSLNISGNELTPNDIAPLSKMQTLNTLNLNDMQLTLPVVEELAQCHQIKYLTFYNSAGLNKATIKVLARAFQLRSIHFGGSDISKRDAQWLEEQLPNCLIDLNSLYVQ